MDNSRYIRFLNALAFYQNNCSDFMSEYDMKIMAERDIEYEEENCALAIIEDEKK